MKKNSAFFLLLAFLLPAALFAQNITRISGKITDDTGAGIANATVSLKNTPVNALSDSAGNFTISVPPAVTRPELLFTHLSFEDKTVVASSSTVNVSLKRKQNQLEEVVVVGYGTQKRTNVSGAIGYLKADKLDERPIARVDQALVGQLAGVTVKQTTGVPGKAFSIQVRGSGSITAGNEPLYVIDGFPLATSKPGSNGNFSAANPAAGTFSTGNPLDNINPNDIDNIQVLKDAAAAAIYGSRASNGVVIITTKRGKTGKPVLAYNAYAGYNEASKKLDMLNGEQWIDRATEMINAAYVLKFASSGATANDDAAKRTSIAGPFSSAYFLDPRWSVKGYPGLQFIDWQKEIERKGLIQNHQVSASGGSEAVRYFVSGNYSDQDGFIRGLDYKSFSARANVDINASKKLKLGINIAPTYSIANDPGVEGKDNIFHQALSMTPVQEDTVGLNANAFKNVQYTWSNTTNSPVAKLQNVVGETKRFRTIASIYGEFQIIKGLTAKSSLNLDNTDNSTRSYTPYVVAGTAAARTFNPASTTSLTAATSGAISSYKRLTFVNENTLNYDHVFNDVHHLNVLLGQSYNIDRLDQSYATSVGGYKGAVIQTLSDAVGTSATASSTQNVLVSYFGRVQYSYMDKYLLSASLREDGSSRFGSNTKYGVFPSASIGWRMTEEDFMKGIPVISDLKLRASYGVNGNNTLPSDYGSIPTLVAAGYIFGATQGVANGQAPGIAANPDLKWEKSQTYDFGLDFGLFTDRIVGSFDYYNKLSTDLLLVVPIPETSGFSGYLTNAGSVRNIGQELEITSRNLINKFQWNTSFNISHNTNKIVSLYGNQTQIIIPNAFDVTDNILQVGQPMNSIYVVQQIGFLTQQDITNKAALYGTGETVGDPKYLDLNHDGVITESDKQIVGHPNPDYTYGITNTFRYKGFDLSVLVQGQTGGSIYSLLGRAITRTGQGFTDNPPAFYEDRWRSPDNQGAGRVSKAYSTFGFVANTDWLYSSDYIRVRTITLGYNLKDILKTRAVQGARIYITAENFFGHDKYYGGLNPESTNTAISSNTNYPQPGDYGGLPLAKSLVFGINVTF